MSYNKYYLYQIIFGISHYTYIFVRNIILNIIDTNVNKLVTFVYLYHVSIILSTIWMTRETNHYLMVYNWVNIVSCVIVVNHIIFGNS